MEIESTIRDGIEKKQLLWYGHMRRMGEVRIPLKVWHWKPARNRKRGRPRVKWKEEVDRDMQRRHIDEESWQNKKQWRFDCDKRPE